MIGTVALAGRVLLALIFVISGLAKIPGWNDTLQYMSQQGIPWAPLFLFPAIFIEVLGGFSILLGYRARLGALILFLYLLPVSVLFHDFWALQGIERQLQLGNFLKNLAIMGGLLQIYANGAGASSLDRYLKHRIKKKEEPSPLRKAS